MSASGSWIRQDKRLAIYLRDLCTCVYCGRKVIPGVDATLGHVVPRVSGGTNHETNLVTACLSCNSAKGALTLRQWYKHLRVQRLAIYLRDDGARVAKRVRRQRSKPLRVHLTHARQLIGAAGSYTGACQAIADHYHELI